MNAPPPIQQDAAASALEALRDGDLEAARQICGGNAIAFRDLGVTLSKVGESAAAILALREAIRLDDNLAEAIQVLIQLYIATQDIDGGVAFFSEHTQVHPGAYVGSYCLGHLHAEAGRLGSAAGYMQQASAMMPEAVQPKYWLGRIFLAMGRYDDAQKEARACLTMQLDQSQRLECTDLANDAAMVQQIKSLLLSSPHPVASPTQARDAWEDEAIRAISAQLDAIAADQLTAVFFHVDAGTQHPYLNMKPGAAVDYQSALVQSCRVAQHANPNTTTIVITDETTDLSGVDAVARCIRLKIPREQMMYSRARSNRALAMSRKINGPALFLDTDIFINRDFRPVFDGGFDVGLTYRPQPAWSTMPLNEGVMLGANGGSDPLICFFGDILNIYETIADKSCARERYGFDVRNWRGGQLSLGALVGWRVPPACTADFMRNGVRYRFLPCADFNHAVLAGDRDEFLIKKWAVHFKGARAKGRMEAYQRFVGAA